MKPLELWRDAKRTIDDEDDERLEIARLRVMRVTALAALAMLVIVLVGVRLTPSANRVGWVFAAPLLMWGVAGMSLWAARRYRATTPELARATRTQFVLLLPVTFAATAFVSWLYSQDVTNAVVTGAFCTGGALFGVCLRTWIAERS